MRNTLALTLVVTTLAALGAEVAGAQPQTESGATTGLAAFAPPGAAPLTLRQRVGRAGLAVVSLVSGVGAAAGVMAVLTAGEASLSLAAGLLGLGLAFGALAVGLGGLGLFLGEAITGRSIVFRPEPGANVERNESTTATAPVGPAPVSSVGARR